MRFGDKIYFINEQSEVVKFKERQLLIDGNYKYNHKNRFYKFWSWLTFKLLATPIAFIVFRIIKRVKFHNRQVLKNFKNDSYFIYANHTNQFCDGFCPSLICFPKKVHIIVNPANITIPIIGKFNKMWGALPIPNTTNAVKNFYCALEQILKNRNPILIYPEAHLWPYYTKIRPFDSSSFRYPVKFNKPVFTFTTIYKKHKILKTPKIEIYVDGPFFANPLLPEKSAQHALRDVVFNKLKERAKLNNYEFIHYLKRSDYD